MIRDFNEFGSNQKTNLGIDTYKLSEYFYAKFRNVLITITS